MWGHVRGINPPNVLPGAFSPTPLTSCLRVPLPPPHSSVRLVARFFASPLRNAAYVVKAVSTVQKLQISMVKVTIALRMTFVVLMGLLLFCLSIIGARSFLASVSLWRRGLAFCCGANGFQIVKSN